MNALEQELVNIGSILANTLATAAAAKNPEYSGLISTGQSLINSINAAVNPTGAAAATTISGDLAASIQPATAALSVVTSKTATAAQKAGVLTTFFSAAETDVEAVFAAFFAKKAPVVASAS